MRKRSGTLEIGFRNGGRPEDYEGEYQCFANNDLGVALSNRILLRVSSEDAFPNVTFPPARPTFLTFCVPTFRGSSVAQRGSGPGSGDGRLPADPAL